MGIVRTFTGAGGEEQVEGHMHIRENDVDILDLLENYMAEEEEKRITTSYYPLTVIGVIAVFLVVVYYSRDCK